MLERLFRLSEHRTGPRTEALAGAFVLKFVRLGNVSGFFVEHGRTRRPLRGSADSVSIRVK